MKRNIRWILLGEVILIAAVFGFCIAISEDRTSNLPLFFDGISLLIIALFLVPGLMITGEWKNFTRAFSVGIRPYSLLELKNTVAGVGAAQKLVVYGALFAFFVWSIIILGKVADAKALGANLSLCFLIGLYAVVLELLLLPLKLNAEKKMNEEMDFENGDDQ
jgi:hypothetical protein